jgi:hypothetical protein
VKTGNKTRHRLSWARADVAVGVIAMAGFQVICHHLLAYRFGTWHLNVHTAICQGTELEVSSARVFPKPKKFSRASSLCHENDCAQLHPAVLSTAPRRDSSKFNMASKDGLRCSGEDGMKNSLAHPSGAARSFAGCIRGV